MDLHFAWQAWHLWHWAGSVALRHTQSLTHHLSHTTLSHTHLSHTIFHIPLCHTPSFTHNFVTHHLSPNHLSHTTLSHTIFHIRLCPTQLFLLLDPSPPPLSFLPYPPRYNICCSVLEEVDLWGYPVL